MPSRAIALGLAAGLILTVGYVAGRPSGTTEPATTRASAAEPVIRVRLLARATSVQIDAGLGRQTIAASDLTALRTFDAADASKPLLVNGRRYRGQVRLVPADSTSPGGAFDVVNVVSIDDYLRGVVPSEVYASWPADALKAQAVAARTYALYQQKSREAVAGEAIDADDAEGRSFDLHADVRSQAYKGVDNETPATNAAVEQTRGLVLAAGASGSEKIFAAFFSNTCGGVTASGLDVFDSDVPALVARAADGCVDAPRYRWPDFTIRKDELTRRVRIWGERRGHPIAACGAIRTLEVTQRNPLGRPSRFTIVDDAARRFDLQAEQLRNACNADGPKDVQFLSSFFTPVDAGESVRITDAHGWGHGVGMCQYCALGWAKRGDDHRAILARSYPGSVVVRAY